MTKKPDASGPQEGQEDDYYRVLSEVMEDHAERQERQRAASRRKDSSGSQNMGIAAMIVGALSIYVWTAPPAFIQPDPYPPPSARQVDAGLRMDIYLQAQQIEKYRQANGSLPASLDEAGEPLEGVEYERAEGDAYRLVASTGGETLVYDSRESAREFLGDAASVVMGGVS